MDSRGGVCQHVKVSMLPLLCVESLKQLCFCVCDYFLVCSVVMLPVFIYAACKRIQLCWYRETCLRQPPVGKSVQLVFTKQVFRVKKLVGRQWGAPNSNYLLVMVSTFVMPFSMDPLSPRMTPGCIMQK